jgi:hypothetical protein
MLESMDGMQMAVVSEINLTEARFLYVQTFLPINNFW